MQRFYPYVQQRPKIGTFYTCEPPLYHQKSTKCHYRNESLPYIFVAVMTFVVTVMTASLRNAQIKTCINLFCSTLN